MKALTSLLLVATCSLVSTQSIAAGKVYKWTDEKGQIHYGQQPPTNTPKEVIKTETAHSDPSPSQVVPDTKTATSTAASSAPAKVADSLKDPERCEAARKNVETLKTYSHIRMKDQDGQYRYLTPDEQKQKLDEATLAVTQSCE